MHPDVTQKCEKCGREYIWIHDDQTQCLYPPKLGEPVCGGRLLKVDNPNRPQPALADGAKESE